MGFFKRLLGICDTRPPADDGCWRYADGRIVVLLDRAPELSKPGGAIRLAGSGLTRRVLVVHGEDGRFVAFPNRCTHAGRRLDPVPGKAEIRCCSIGKSAFDYEGQRLSGLAKQPVRPLKVEQREGELIISVE